MESSFAFATQAVHAGERAPKPDFTPVNTPIYQSASFVYDTIETMDAIFAGERPGYVYTRYGKISPILRESQYELFPHCAPQGALTH